VLVLYVEVTHSAPDGCGLIRLLGTDPTDPSLWQLPWQLAAGDNDPGQPV